MKFFFKKTLFSFFLLFCFGKIQSQTPFQIQGAVLDSETLEPLSEVNIKDISNDKKGTSTNEDGIFQIEISKLPTTLKLTSIGYESFVFKIENGDQREFVIKLRPTSTDLPEVAVSSKRKVDTIFFKPYSVVDYVFYKEKIFLLAHRNSIDKYTLIALDETTHEEIAELPLKEYSPKGLFKHCTGGAYLVTESNVYKIEIGAEGIFFPKKIFLGDFYLIEQPCVLATEKFLYFARYFYQGQALKYIAFAHDLNPSQQNGEEPLPIDSLEKHEFPLIQNEPNIVRLIEELGLRLPWSGDIWDTYSDERLHALMDSKYKLEGIMKVFYPPLNIPIVTKGNEILMFNHFANELQFFSEKGDSLRSVSINYHKNRKWKKKLFFDKIQNRAYTTFNTRWGERIHEIDLIDGTIGEAIQLDLAFVEKSIIRDGYIYFLYRDSWGGERRKKLKRMRVE